MGISDKLKDLSQNVQQGTKQASYSFSHITLRLISGFFVGLVLALILQEMLQTGDLVLVFSTAVFIGIIYRLLAKLSLVQILIFDLICVLIGTLLKMYILIAPQ